MDAHDNETHDPPANYEDLVRDAEQELLDSLLTKYEPDNQKENQKNDDTKDMIRELERLTLELSLAIEEKKLNRYFDKQYRIYLVEQLSVSPLFADRIEAIIDLVKEDSIRIIADNEIVSGTVADLSKLFMPEESSEFIISIESREFLDSILETYDSDRAIINQFLHDFFRQIVSINDMIYDDIDALFLELSTSNRKTTIRSRAGKPISTMMLLLLITCQSSHYLSYLYPHNSITEMRDRAAQISQLDSESKFEDSRAAYYVMNSNDFNVTNIIIDHIDVRPEIGCVIDSTYKIFDTQDCEKVYDIKAQTIFNERSDRCLIRYKVTKV
jgi:hypothetical protein